VAGIFLLALVRSADLVWNRYYLSAGQLSIFGPGISWWYPERATGFLLRERLPRNLFNDYNTGGYLTWRIGPEYPVSIDGRLIPFGSTFFNRYRSLMQSPLDSEDWQREADSRNINTVILSVARFGGLGSFPLQQYCGSATWRPVYLDDVAAIFLRNRPENAPWLKRLEIDCMTARFEPPPPDPKASRARQNGELYNFYANSGSAYYVLGRKGEAWDDLESAEGIFPDDSNLHLTKGQLFQSNGTMDLAEEEYLKSLRLRPTDTGWYLLGRLQATNKRYADAANAFSRAADLSSQPWDRFVDLGETLLLMQRPEEALSAFARAERLSPFSSTTGEGARFFARVAAGRARAAKLDAD
jgi:tetratricopeptide (TPR) repeat protein